MDIGLLVGVIGFVVAAAAAVVVAYLKGRTVFAAAGLLSVVSPLVLLVLGRRQLGRQEDGLVALGMAMGYATLMLIMAGVLLVIAAVGAVLQPKAGSRWTHRRRRSPT